MLDDAIGKAIKSMAMIGSQSERAGLEREAKLHSSVKSWKRHQIAKSSGVGFGTGVLGGPWGLALEAADLAYLLAQAGRGCYGVGHIRNRQIDYDLDIPLILAVWSGAGETATAVSSGKVAIKIGGKTGLALAANAGGKVAGKIIAKSTLNVTGKIGAKILAKAAAKLSSKIVAKTSVKWIPVVGGVVGAGINGWVMDGLLESADMYYTGEYLVLDSGVGFE